MEFCDQSWNFYTNSAQMFAFSEDIMKSSLTLERQHFLTFSAEGCKSKI